MNRLFLFLLLLLPASAAPPASSITLENRFLKRTISLGETIGTTAITNKLDGKTLTPTAGEDFVIHLADGPQVPASDFSTVKVDDTTQAGLRTVTVHLTCANPALKASIRYQLHAENFHLRKTLTLTSPADLRVARIDVDSIQLADAYQPYTISQITARGVGKWRPGLGQPLYTRHSGTFWGLEHPAAINTVKDGRLTCSYLVGKTLPANTPYTTPSAVFGVADSPDFVQDAFFDYIDRTRIRPLRLQTQYNSWFDFGQGVSAANFATSVERLHQELVTERGVPPLKAYVIDDGWQDTGADWTKGTWPVNKKFDPDFSGSFKATSAAKSNLGLWLSPGAIFGASPAIPKMKAGGFRTLDPWMSLNHPAYMDLLEKRMVELAKSGVTYFKLDGIFGHLNNRNFDIEGFKGGEAELNDPKYDLQKIQYLTDSADRLNRIFAAMAAVNPDVYIVISNGAWLSPWWLHHIDASWMINADDAAAGSNRTGELVYRDQIYHELAVREHTQFPLHSIFNHEPKKTDSNETKDAFRRYLYLSMSRGTGFIELYLKTQRLKTYDWDVLAEGLHWAHDVFPTFKRARMHGGNPGAREVYGYTAWLDDRGYVSIHNPAREPKSYTFTLNRAFGLTPSAIAGKTVYHISSPIDGSLEGLEKTGIANSTFTLKLQPGEIRILNFDTRPRDWSTLRKLQTRTAEDFHPPEPVAIKGHALLGIWHYTAEGAAHSREFKPDGTCILRRGETVIWTKPFTAADAKTLIVEGGHQHTLDPGGSLKIEGRYTAKK